MDGEPERFLREVVMAYDGDECLTWPYGKNSHGYAVWTGGTGSNLVSRQICEEAHGPAPTPKHEAAHGCGHGGHACVTKRHLSWKTPAQNQADRVAHGTSNRGQRQWMAKLTESDVREIRASRGTVSQSALAEQFGVSQTHVGLIQRKKTWAWLSEREDA